MGASLTAKLIRAAPKDFRRALADISRAMNKPIGPTERQDPETQRALFLDWAASLGLKVERHEKPVI